MSHVLSLIGAEAKALLTEAIVDEVRRELDRLGVPAGTPDWLSADEACDIPLEASHGDTLTAVRTLLREQRLDVNLVPTRLRRKRLIIADMDSTLIEQECIDELAQVVGVRSQVAGITERAMRGEVAFEPALRERVSLLKGLRSNVAAQVLSDRIKITPGAAVLVATMRASGAYAALVSGGFSVFTGPIAARIGFDEHRANTLLLDQAGALTGAVAEPILGQSAKEDALLELTQRLKLDPAETLAVGDGANDIGMVRLAGLGVAYRAKPALRAAADAIVDHADLTALLFLQGYRREEFVLRPDLPGAAQPPP